MPQAGSVSGGFLSCRCAEVGVRAAPCTHQTESHADIASKGEKQERGWKKGDCMLSGCSAMVLQWHCNGSAKVWHACLECKTVLLFLIETSWFNVAALRDYPACCIKRPYGGARERQL